MLLLAREVSAVDAAAWGMVSQVVAADQREAATQALVARVLALSAYSQTHIKANLNRIYQGQHGDDAATGQAFAAAFAGPDFQAAAEAFAKR
jgi:enoyl-CoA hydratase/carnithine racemase